MEDQRPQFSGLGEPEPGHDHANGNGTVLAPIREGSSELADTIADDITVIDTELGLDDDRDDEKDEEKGDAERREAERDEKAAEAGLGTQPHTQPATTTSQDQNTIERNQGADAGPFADSANLPPRPYEKLAQKNPKPTEHLSITIGPPVILLFDVIVPCIIYYVWFDIHRARWVDQCRPYDNRNETCPIVKPEYDKDILGYAIISFGFGEVYILIARVARLLMHRDLCAPLLSRSKWELDATSWVYGVAMIMALIPFVVGSSLEIPKLYLYSPGFLMSFLAILMLVTLIPFKIPIGVNSHKRGTSLRPFIYYAAEDFIAVDGLQDREFRVRYNERYDSSKQFRRMFTLLTFWWIAGVAVYLGCLSAVIWTLEFHFAFGLSLGVLFGYIVLWAGASYWYVMFDMGRQRKYYEAHGAFKC